MKKITLLLFGLVFVLSAHAQNFVNIGGTRFMVDLDNRNMTATIVDYEHEVEDVKYPVKIGNRKLARHSEGDVLQIPATVTVNNKTYRVTAIGRAAFADYKNLQYVNIPATVTSIGEYAFFGSGLRDVTVPASVLSIGARAFGKCSNLRRLTLPTEVAMGKDVYAESAKKISIRRFDDMPETMDINTGNYRASTSTKSSDPSYPWVSSDLDVDIPNAQISAENTYVVIIANEHYEYDPAVEYAIQDGRTFKTYCEQTLGIPGTNIRMKEDATLNNMRTMVNWMQEISKVNGSKARFIFYYSGHGSQGENDITGLLPVDGTALDELSGYSLTQLYDALGEIESDCICVFLDACFSGKQKNGDLVVASKGGRRAKSHTPKGNMVVFSAAQDKETAFSYPEKGHGIFTYYLLKKIKESKGNVTLGELAEYIESNVSKTSRKIMNSKQTPITTISPTIDKKWSRFRLTDN